MATHKVYILNDLFPSYDRERAALARADAEAIVINPNLPEDDLIEACRDAAGVMVDRWPLTRKMIFGMPNLQVISVYGIGTDAVDIPAATERRIPVANLPGFCAEDVSEQAIMLLLATARKLVNQNNGVKSREVGWTQEPFTPIYRLAGKTLGLVGLGSIGRAVARKAQGLGMSVMAYDPYLPPEAGARLDVELVPLRELFQRADHISLHVGVTTETLNLVNADLLRLMKPTGVLVNTSRGKIVDQGALVTALREGWIAGAGLDVVSEDPPSEATHRDLLSLPNVVVTPHTAWYSEESFETLQTGCADNVARVLLGERPSNTVNPEVYD